MIPLADSAMRAVGLATSVVSFWPTSICLGFGILFSLHREGLMRALVCLYLLLIVTEARGFAQTNPQNLKKLSLEELMKIDVTTVARKPEPLDRTPAAITVITAEDIRRSGATRIPEVLRLVP